MKYLVGQGYPLIEEACEEAVRYGYLDCLKYLHEKGCPWDARTTYEAIITDQLECLRYAYENGCPINRKWLAAIGAEKQCRPFLLEQGFLE